MGSPYFVHKAVNNVNVIKTEKGFFRLLDQVCGTMSLDRRFGKTSEVVEFIEDNTGPETVVLDELFTEFLSAITSRKRSVLFLESRYEWHGWEKFQRAIVFDFTKLPVEKINLGDKIDSCTAAGELTPMKWCK